MQLFRIFDIIILPHLLLHPVHVLSQSQCNVSFQSSFGDRTLFHARLIGGDETIELTAGVAMTCSATNARSLVFEKKSTPLEELGVQRTENCNDTFKSITLRFPTIDQKFLGPYTCTARPGDATPLIFTLIESKGTANSNSFIAGVSVTIAVVTLLLVWIFYEFFGPGKNGLTKEEIQEFLHGNIEAIRNGAYAHENANYMPYKNSYEVPQDRLYVDRTQLLGSGQYGEVFIGRFNNKSVAVKTVKPGADKMYLKSLLAELKIMIYLGPHPNIVSLVGASTNGLSMGRLYIIVDCCDLGSLDKYLKKHKASFVSQIDEFGNLVNYENRQVDSAVTTKDLILWSHQIAKGMGFLESKKVIHGDLAARNLLLADKHTLKITDFGLSRQLYDYTPNYLKKNMEPLPWRSMAYESLRELTFSSASDCWAYGVTIWELFSLGDVPYAGLHWTNEFVESLANGFKLSKPPNMMHTMYCEILKCWNLEPQQRPKFTELENYFHAVLENVLTTSYQLPGQHL